MSARGWTGGQYSVLRALVGAYLFVHFGALVPYSEELFGRSAVVPLDALPPSLASLPNLVVASGAPAAFALLGAALALAFAAGWNDRWAAFGLWYVWACLPARNPLISNPSLPYIGWLLLAHAALPGAPYGSLRAAGRPDPAGAWRFPSGLHRAAWLVLAAGYSFSGWTKLSSASWVDGGALRFVLENPLARDHAGVRALLALPDLALAALTWGTLSLELFFLPLALVPRLRPALWALSTAMHAGILLTVDFADLTLGMLLFHLLCFDPAWLPARGEGGVIEFDGRCGLCSGFVRFVLAEDRRAAFRFRPFAEARPTLRLLAGGRTLERGEAVRAVLDGLGGLWRLGASALGVLPRSLVDRLYDEVAKRRRRGDSACPVIPERLRGRLRCQAPLPGTF